MAARRMMVAVLGTVAVLGLAGCGPKGGQAAAGTVSAPVTTAAADSTPAPAPPSTAATDATAPTWAASSSVPGDAPGGSCSSPAVAPGHHVVVPTARPTQAIMFARTARFACDQGVGGGHYAATGEPKTYQFASGATAQLVLDNGEYKSVLVGDLWVHIGDCLDGGAKVEPPLSCSTYPAYDITQNAQGEITAIKELWHS